MSNKVTLFSKTAYSRVFGHGRRRAGLRYIRLACHLTLMIPVYNRIPVCEKTVASEKELGCSRPVRVTRIRFKYSSTAEEDGEMHRMP